jgi:quercetin dioxygenase-like cupin family protein
MKPITGRFAAATLGIALASLLAAGTGAAQSPTLDLVPGDIAWLDSPTPGVKTAVLSGSLVQPGLYILRVKIAKDAKLMPHTHPDVRYTTVLSGEMHFGFGDAFDAGRMKTYPAGAIIAIPANTPHFVWARDGDVIVQDTGIGPTGTAPLRK